MKRLALLAAILVVPASLFADTTTHRYLVATTHHVGVTISKDVASDVAPDVASDVIGENVRTFASVDGYAADLTDAQVAELRASKSVKDIEPVLERHAYDVFAAEPIRGTAGQTVPYGISLVRAPEVWPVVNGAGINVVVIDSGIDYRHPELAPLYAGGYNLLANTDTPVDDLGHGTHCAGIIAAANNTDGVVGVAPGVRLWALKVLNSSGSGSDEDIIRALDWVIAKKAELGGDWIVSLSLGSAGSSKLEAAAFAKAIDANILPVAASGNESTATKPAPIAYPAAYPGVISVGAVDSTSTIAEFSNQGPTLSVVAPGVSVLSTLPLGSATYAAVQTPSETLTAATLTGSPRGTVSGAYVYCNLGRVQDFTSAVRGKIALIKRGDITFNEKTKNALNAGATAVVIFNKDTSALAFTLISQTCDNTGINCVDSAADLAFTWPLTLAIGQGDGEALAAAGTGQLTVTAVPDDYGSLSGTSMATPHVAGVAALVWAADPAAPPAAVKNAIEQSAKDLGAAGHDNVFGFGLADAYSAAKLLAPQRFGTGATPVIPPSPGRSILRRGH
jgi:subtilisin family serine protease